MTAPDPYVERARKWLEDYVGSVGTILKDNLAAEFRAVAAEAQREGLERAVAKLREFKEPLGAAQGRDFLDEATRLVDALLAQTGGTHDRE